jgi:hypothetical protein
VARQAERAAAGSPADAVVWEEVESRTSENAELSFSFVVFIGRWPGSPLRRSNEFRPDDHRSDDEDLRVGHDW